METPHNLALQSTAELLLPLTATLCLTLKDSAINHSLVPWMLWNIIDEPEKVKASLCFRTKPCKWPSSKQWFCKTSTLKVSGLSVLRKTTTMIKKHDLVLANDKMTVSSEKSPQKKSLCTSSVMKNSITTCIYVHMYVWKQDQFPIHLQRGNCSVVCKILKMLHEWYFSKLWNYSRAQNKMFHRVQSFHLKATVIF